MSKDFAQIANDVVTGVRLLRQGAPDTMKAFAALSMAATASRAIDTKTKELMALAIGIAVHCDGCVAYHTKMAHQHGASREEVAETVALAVYMGGGPAAVYGGDALRAVCRHKAVTLTRRAKVNDGRPRDDAEKPMAISERRAVTVLLTEEHLGKMIEDHLLKENEIGDRIKVARIVQKLLDTSLGLPDRTWRDWDEWAKGFE